MAIDYNKYSGNNDFRGFLAGNGLNDYLAYTGNDGKVDQSALERSVYGTGKVLGNTGTQVRAIQSEDNGDANSNLVTYTPTIISGLYSKWSAAQKQRNATDAGSGVYAGDAGASGGAADTTAADLAYLDDQEGLLKGMLGSADKTLANGRTQIADSFNKELSRTNQSKSAATAKYNTEREDTTRSKQGAVDQVNTGARTLSDSVRRMLGMAAGTHSTAFQEAAPNMIARDATIKRSGVMDTYGKNFRDIDTAQNDTNLSFDQYLQDLADQRKEKESGLEQGVLQQKQQLNTNLGQVARDRASVQGGSYSSMRAASSPYQAAATNAQTALDGLFEKFRTPYQTKDVQVAAPNLRDYTVDRTALQANNGQGNPASPDSLYQQVLKKKFSDAAA